MTVGILLVGGRGTRLSPITSQIPKPMLPIAGKPVTEHQIIAAQKAGITTLVLATSYLSEVFTPYFGDGSKWGIDLRYAVEKEPLGTGGAIAHAATYLDAGDAGDADQAVVIFNGDILTGHDLSAQISFHQRHKADVTLHLIHVEDARAFGCVPTDDEGRVLAFMEKMENPVTNWINAGCYIFNREIIDAIPQGKVISVERETFPGLVERKRRVFGYKESAYWLDIGTPAALFKGTRDYVAGDFIAAPTAAIDATARVIGGSSIGSGTVISAGAHIENSIIGEDVGIGQGAQISRSFIASGSKVEAGAEVIDRYICATENLPIIF